MRADYLFALAAIVMGVRAQSGTCFDDGDCFFSGGKCNKDSGAITGTCSTASTTGSSGGGSPFPTSFPGGGSGGSIPGGGGSTGGTCFDDGDCFFSGGKCTKDSGAITGTCSTDGSGSGSGGSPFPTGFKRVIRKAD